MKDYTQQLKSYWKSVDLEFIAKLHKINNTQGFFNYFINPVSKMTLFYPVFDEIELDDKRVSFFYGDSMSLNHGDYYKIELEFSEKANGKNNPYYLEIKSVGSLDQEKVKQLLEDSRIVSKRENNKYFGCYHKVNDKFCVFEYVMNVETRELLMRESEYSQVYVTPKINLNENSYYSFKIRENIGRLPNAIVASIEKINVNPYKKFIRSRFERLNNPEANRIIANLMREIGKGMYSSKQRMIFELLQNADDAPGKEKVEFHIDINGEYFFVMHDGAPFNEDDVEAITSAAESTKKSNIKKTGYKGIGFKSVFTDSSEVWLKSGGYQFAFLRNNEFFEDFDKFYFSSERYKKYPELLEEDKLKYRNQKLRFNGSTDIPWQVIPIWQDHLPEEFSDSNFNNFNNPVQFALKLGEANIEEYKLAIDNITKRPQFLLFLRNTSKFRSPKNGVTVFRKDNLNIIEIIKDKKGDQIQNFFYTKHTYENIEVSDNAFLLLNIGLKKESRINDYNEVSYFFTDLDGKEIETIPPKLALANETEISFGISLVDGRISPEREYLNGLPKYSSLFTYLPMEDSRFQLPFLVNADFIPSSDRQKIQGDNPWNKYIMINVAEKHIEVISKLADDFIYNKDKYKTYLSLLLKNTLPEDDTAQQIIDSYNQKYIEQLETIPFIVNDTDQKQLLSQTIIDDSGLIELFGHELFYEIIDTDKKLPHPDLEIKYLKQYSYLDLEIINIEILADKITPELCEKIGEVIKVKALYNEESLLKWLNKLVEYLPSNFGKIPFIFHNDSLFSLESLVSEQDAWILNKHTTDYNELFEALGYHTVNLQLEKFTKLNNFLLSYDGYLNDKTKAYERIYSNQKLFSLPIHKKIELIDFLQQSKFMYGIGVNKYFGEIKVFVDEGGTPRPLRQLISREVYLEIKSIKKFRINEDEYNAIPESLKSELIHKAAIFCLFILNRVLFDEWSIQFSSKNIETYVVDLKSIFSWKNEKDEILQSQWASIPWLYVDDELRFIGSEKLFWSPAFIELSDEKYQKIKKIFHKFQLKILPFKECGVLIQKFELKTESSPISDWTVVKDLDTISLNILLDWMEEDGTFHGFFEEYNIIMDNSLWSVNSAGDKKIFDGTESPLKDYINANELLKSLFTELPDALCSETRYKIGLLQGDKLLKSIIDSKSFDQKLATHLPQNLNWKLLDGFISNLDEFNLTTGNEYNSLTPEHIILSHLLKAVEDINLIPDEVQTTIGHLREKIKINQNPLNFYDLSDRIPFGKAEDKKVLRLSDVVEEFKGESDILDHIIESFVSIKEKAKLRKLVFNTRTMHYDDICSKIEAESSNFYSEHQVVFQLLYQKYVGEKKWAKRHFDEIWEEQGNKVQLQSAYKNFLDIIYDLNFTDIGNFYFYNLKLQNCVDKNFAVESEVLPQWIVEWIDIDQVKRLPFVSELGYNGMNSPIVKLRQSLIADQFEANTVIRYFEEAKPNTQIIWNTIEWLSKYSSQIITRNIDLIKQINDYITLKTNDLNAVLIPVIESIDNENKRSYILQNVNVDINLFVLEMNEEFACSIFNTLNNLGSKLIFIDGHCGKKSGHFKTETINLKVSVDTTILTNESILWDEPFYVKWEYFSKYPIFIYEGNEIPYKRTFNDITINKFSSDLKVKEGDNYYVSSILKTDVLNNLPSEFPQEALIKLKDWHYKTLQNETLLDEDSFEYKEDIDRLIQDKLGISEEEQKSESGNAKTHAVYFLFEEGYDVTNINTVGASLTNIIDPDGNNIKCIVRSAKGGLLYLDKDHWDMLEDSHTFLVVIYPGNRPRLFKDRLELLNEELSENVLFRIPNSKQTAEIDGVFNALKSESHLILVTSEKMKESLFSKLKQNKQFKKELDSAVAGDDFKF